MNAEVTWSRRVLNLIPLLLVLFQLWLLLRLTDKLNLESLAFRNVLKLAAGGFILHHFLPLRFRLPFFVLLSLTSIVVVFAGSMDGLGAGLLDAGMIVGIGLVLIGICHLPIQYGARVTLLLLVAVGLGFTRNESHLAATLGPLLPILGAMFMFRLMVYLYDKEHDPKPQPLTSSLAYFFMLPSACFPLLPVVDYKAFRKSHFNGDAVAIYQKGLRWMVRGVVHLLLYRIIYYYFYIDTQSVAFGSDVTVYMLCASLLYLRVSGQFHVVIGLLHLFGFNLPETNRRYFLASSFTDYWRRVNIYWKDFILKVFYYPMYFRLKAWGPIRAMVAATAGCFFLTWLLHAYQSFWIRGTFAFSAPDALFWSVLGLLVVVNSVMEARRSRARTLTSSRITWPQRFAKGARTIATFTVICTLWSIWTADSLEGWARIWTVADMSTAMWGGVILLIIFVLAVFEGHWTTWMQRLGARDDVAQPVFSLRSAVIFGMVPLMALSVVTSGRVSAKFDEGTRAFLASITSNKPNEYDEDAMERGYYENLMDVGRSNPQLAAIFQHRPADWLRIEQTDALIPTGDYRLKELAPSKSTFINGVTITTNEWGMRDRSYTLDKPPGTYRIAVLNASATMGWGVENPQTYENLLEDRLNERPPLPGFSRYEVLNFGVNGYSAVCDLVALEKKVLAFKPDAILFLANATDDDWVKQRLAKSLRGGVAPPYEFLRQVVDEAGVRPNMPEQAALRRLRPFARKLMRSTYDQMVEVCRENNIVPIWFLLPRIVGGEFKKKEAADLLADAQAAGFVTLELSGVFQGHPHTDLVVAAWDSHPNAKGHQLIANALYRELVPRFESGMLQNPLPPNSEGN